MRDALNGFLQSFGFAGEIFSSAEDFLRSGSRGKTRCLIVDVHIPAMIGVELQRHLGTQCPIPKIFITALDDPPARAQALKAGAVDFLKEPFAGEALLKAIHAALGGQAEGRGLFIEGIPMRSAKKTHCLLCSIAESAIQRRVKCQRCDADPAQFRMMSEILNIAVCAACAAEARKLGLNVKDLENSHAQTS